MIRLLEIRRETAEAIRRVSAKLKLILSGVREKIDPGRDEGHYECSFCGDGYIVETDAFNDGGIKYWPEAMVEFGEEL